MTQQEFNRLILCGSEEELHIAIQRYPELAEKCMEQVLVEVKEFPVFMDDLDYQRLIDHGMEDIEGYDYMSVM